MLLNPLSHLARRAPLLSRTAAAPLASAWSASASASVERTSAAPAPLSSRGYLASAPRSTSHAAPAKFGSADWHSTTILCVRKDGQVCMIGDGMVSMGNVTIKPNARKIRRIATKSDRDRIGAGAGADGDKSGGEGGADEGGVIVGFAGATADAFTLLERLEGKIDEYPGQLARSCVELAKGWRTDKYLRRLEASMLVADPTISLEITGNGDVLESHDGVMGVGSGAFYAMAAARALVDIPDMSAEDVARKAMNITADMCVYTNKEFVVESMATVEPKEENKEDDDEEGK